MASGGRDAGALLLVRRFLFLSHGYLTIVGQSPNPCAFPPCTHHAEVTLRLLVDGDESAVPACRHHAHWLRSYAEEDAAVQLVDELYDRPRRYLRRDAGPD